MASINPNHSCDDSFRKCHQHANDGATQKVIYLNCEVMVYLIFGSYWIVDRFRTIDDSLIIIGVNADVRE
jgi:hypothetical protein